MAERAAEGAAGSDSRRFAGLGGGLQKGRKAGGCVRERSGYVGGKWHGSPAERARQGRRREGAFGGQGSRGCVPTVSAAWPKVEILKAS